MLPDVVIPVKDRLDLTASLILQLEVQGGYDHIFVFDNGSGEETKAWLADSSAVVVDADGWNIHEMWNCGLDMSSGHVAILNNDLVLGEGFLDGLRRALEIDPALAAVCPNYDQRLGQGIRYVSHLANTTKQGVRGFAGFAFVLAEDWAQTYQFPEELNWWYGDNHLVDTIVQSGRKTGILLDVSVKHLVSQTGGDWRRHREQIQADRRWYRRWRESVSSGRNAPFRHVPSR